MTPLPIVVPTDLSAAAAEALALAARLAGATGAPLHLLHVLSWPDAGPFEAPGEGPTATDEETGEVQRAHGALAEVAPEGAVLAVRRSAVVAAEVVRYAAEVDAGLVVMGTCGRRPRPVGLGAIAGEAVQTAPCDVLLVPHRPEAAPDEGRVLVPVDFSGASRPLLALGLDLARTLGTGVDLVHVLEPLPHPVRWIDETVVDLVPQIRERAGAALRELADDASEAERAAGRAVPDIALYVERGKAARTIPRVAEALGSGLVAVGPHAERPVFDRLLGSVAEGVARRAPCPVLIARRSAAPGPDGDAVDAWSYRPEPAASPDAPPVGA